MLGNDFSGFYESTQTKKTRSELCSERGSCRQESSFMIKSFYRISITSIENFPNELFYEIFGYLNGCRIYQAFSSLNHRFEQLLNSSSLLLRINLRSYDYIHLLDKYKYMIYLNRHQIFSIHLNLPFHMDEVVLSFPIDSSFQRLESLVLGEDVSNILRPVLLRLTCLPRLFSLTIIMNNDVTNLTEIYRIILALPVLKYFKCSKSYSDTSIFLPIATEKQFSSIKHLVIDHSCNFEQLASIVSYTPQLCRLSFKHSNRSLSNIGLILPIALASLTHLSLNVFHLKFDAFQLFINHLDFKVKVFSLTTTNSNDIDYLDANQWKELILKNFRHLQKFYFTYSGDIKHVNRSPQYLDSSNQFTSSFWTERQWLFEATINSDRITFSIHPHKKQWYEIGNEIFLSNRLTITFHNVVIMDINRILSLGQIYHLEIAEQNVSFARLIQITNLLRELKSLKIHSLSTRKPRNLSVEAPSYTSQITKVYVQVMINFEAFYMLLDLCPSMEYLEMGYTGDLDMELISQMISRKMIHDRNDHLRLLCFHVLRFEDDDQMMEQAEKVINLEKSLRNYTMKRIGDKIYLQWKR